MICRRTLQLSDELLSCQLADGHGGYHQDQSGIPFGPWADHDATPLADRPLPTTVPAWPHPTESAEESGQRSGECEHGDHAVCDGTTPGWPCECSCHPLPCSEECDWCGEHTPAPESSEKESGDV